MIANNALIDSFGRRINYLRISLTDRCNFRCHYCMPEEGLDFLPSNQFLTPQEIRRFVNILGVFGTFRLRLTGGEPLLRKEILEIIQSLKPLPSVSEISLTTNGSLLSHYLPGLKKAGLDRINISLDSLDPRRFQEITLSNLFHKVYEATFQALEMGFPVKLNMVVLKGLSESEIVEYVNLAYHYPLEVRFLEFMPLCGLSWQNKYFLAIDEVRKVVLENFSVVDEEDRRDQVAQVFSLKGGKGKIGFIASLSEAFCNDCSRFRLTAHGKIRPCLFSNVEVDVGQLLKENASDEEILKAIQEAAIKKPKGSLYFDKPYSGQEESPYKGQSTPLIRTIGG